MMVCASTASISDAVVFIRDQHPDVLLLDLHLKDGTGWSLIEKLSATGELPRTLVFSVFDENIYAERLLRAGARGYLSKTAPMAQVVQAVRKVVGGNLAASDAVVTRMFNAWLGSEPANSQEQETAELRTLSDREIQVMQMLGEGLGNKEVGEQLNLSPKTVSTYKARLMRKLGVQTTPELQRLAVQRLRSVAAA
jgi:DNA-binding NarL/FixJ family response regulator